MNILTNLNKFLNKISLNKYINCLKILIFFFKLILFISSIIFFGTFISEIFADCDIADDISNINDSDSKDSNSKDSNSKDSNSKDSNSKDSDSKPKKKSRREWGMQLITIAIFTYTAVPLFILTTFPKTCEAFANSDVMASGFGIALISTAIFCNIAAQVLRYDLKVEAAYEANNVNKVEKVCEANNVSKVEKVCDVNNVSNVEKACDASNASNVDNTYDLFDPKHDIF